MRQHHDIQIYEDLKCFLQLARSRLDILRKYSPDVSTSTVQQDESADEKQHLHVGGHAMLRTRQPSGA